jgi:neutral ceramidase
LPAKIAECVRHAHERLEPAQLKVARSRCEGLTFNRRYFMRDGTVGWNPGKLNPQIVLPAGPSDAELGIFYVERPGASGPAQGIATYVNFAMHTDTTGGSKISADWPGALARVLAGYHGAHHQTFTGLGACGNLNHLDFNWGWPQSSPSEQHRIGTVLGAAVFQAYKELQPVAGAQLCAAMERVALDPPEITPQQVEEARRVLAEAPNDRGANFMRLVRAYRTLDVAARQGQPHQAEVQVLSLGSDVAWVGLPGEVFVELGLAIKRRSPFPHTYVVSLANDNIGYIPDRRSYAEGNYEPESARCAAGSGEKLVETAVGLLTRLHQEL